MFKYEWQRDEAERTARYKEYVYWKKVGQNKADQTIKLAGWEFRLEISKIPFRVPTGYERDQRWDAKASHYVFRLTRKGSQAQAFVGQYSQGSAILTWPRAYEIMHSLASDAISAFYGFKNFCSDFGHDTDSRRALAMFELCDQTREWFVGNYISHENIQEIFENTESDPNAPRPEWLLKRDQQLADREQESDWD